VQTRPQKPRRGYSCRHVSIMLSPASSAIYSQTEGFAAITSRMPGTSLASESRAPSKRASIISLRYIMQASRFASWKLAPVASLNVISVSRKFARQNDVRTRRAPNRLISSQLPPSKGHGQAPSDKVHGVVRKFCKGIGLTNTYSPTPLADVPAEGLSGRPREQHNSRTCLALNANPMIVKIDVLDQHVPALHPSDTPSHKALPATPALAAS
jgi:hypothetical protein